MFSGREVSIADLWMDLSDPESTLFGQFWHLRGRGYKSVSLPLAWRDLGKSVGLRRPYEAAFGEDTLPYRVHDQGCHPLLPSCLQPCLPACLPACLPRITSNSVCCLSPCCPAVCRPAVLLPCCPAVLLICRPALLAPCCTAALSPGLSLLNALPLAT